MQPQNRSIMASTYLKHIFLFACVVLFSSCVSLKQNQQIGIKPIHTLDAFNGIYENIFTSKDSLNYASLWRQLHLDNHLDAADFRAAKIELRSVDKRSIKAIWWQNETALAEIHLKGKLKDNYFVSKAKRTIIPIPLIYGQIKNNQFQLALNTNNELLLDRLENQWGWVFVFLANNDSSKSYTYHKIK